uniref:Leishmanolysin-like peptidase n=1 Tax=Periophthalmus magnuspinnatus TaxID=409849 RepID=A0A3B3ZIF2_9GOBI
MDPRLTCDRKPVTVSWILGSALVISSLALFVSCHGTCNHKVPAPEEVSRCQQSKNNTLYKMNMYMLNESAVSKINIELNPPPIICRQCATNQYLRKRDDPHRYCQGACAEVTKCGPVVVPQHHLQQCKVCSETGKSCGPSGPADGSGVEDSDFVLYVSGITTERCGQENIVAYAAYCQLEAQLDRPIAGYANLCPAMISSQPQEFEGMLSTVKHEIIHALGFSAGLFAFFHDDEGRPLTPRFASGLPPFNETLGLYQWSEAVIRRVTRLWNTRGERMLQHQVHVLVTPRVREEARRHFNCPILEGMELENQGGTGTELNHWEKRLLENEAMTGSHTQNRVFSRLTLALMEDSGWYRANYSLAQRLDWGRGLGCDFVMKSCKFWMDNQRERHSVTPFCDTVRASPLQLTCRQDQLAVAVCNLQKYPQELPQEYQYFDQIPDVATEELSYFGGAVEIADFCPFSQEFSWHLSGEYQRNSYCRVTENQPDWWRNYGAEQYGPESVCLYQKSAFVMEQCTRKMSYPDWGSGCYKVSCSPQGLVVHVHSRSYLCLRKGQPLSVSVKANDWVYNGVLLCPDCLDFCDLCPLPHQIPPTNTSRSNPIDPCSSSAGLVTTLWLLMLNLLPLVAGLLLCHCS